MQALVTTLGVLVIILAIYAIIRQVDVRLALTAAAFILGGISLLVREDAVLQVTQAFLRTLGNDSFIIPICSAMAFAYVLRHTGCDLHLVQLLSKPVQRFRSFLIPGTVVIAFLVNIPIISQTSTAVTVGPVLIPLLRAANISPITSGAALLLGASVAGELLNPGAPELQTVATHEKIKIDPRECVNKVLPLALIQLAVATSIFWWMSARFERRLRDQSPPPEDNIPSPEEADTMYEEHVKTSAKATTSHHSAIHPAESRTDHIKASGTVTTSPDSRAQPEAFQVNYVKALIPLVPLVLLFVTGPPLNLVHVDLNLLVAGNESRSLAPPRLIGVAMLIGVLAAACTAGRQILEVGKTFFEGAGYAYGNVVSLIVCAVAFGKGVEMIGLAGLLGEVITGLPALLWPLAAGFPLLFGFISGSGMAATQSLFRFYVEPSLALDTPPADVGVVVAMGAAAGRTMSPVSAVNLMSASLTGTSSFALSRRVAPPLLVGIAVIVVMRMIFPVW